MTNSSISGLLPESETFLRTNQEGDQITNNPDGYGITFNRTIGSV